MSFSLTSKAVLLLKLNLSAGDNLQELFGDLAKDLWGFSLVILKDS